MQPRSMRRWWSVTKTPACGRDATAAGGTDAGSLPRTAHAITCRAKLGQDGGLVPNWAISEMLSPRLRAKHKRSDPDALGLGAGGRLALSKGGPFVVRCAGYSCCFFLMMISTMTMTSRTPMRIQFQVGRPRNSARVIAHDPRRLMGIRVP